MGLVVQSEAPQLIAGPQSDVILHSAIFSQVLLLLFGIAPLLYLIFIFNLMFQDDLSNSRTLSEACLVSLPKWYQAPPSLHSHSTQDLFLLYLLLF